MNTRSGVAASAVTERSKRKYDDLADRYEEVYFYVADLGERLISLADPAPGTKALDIGAGRGAVARAALAKGCAVTAVDVSPRMVELLAADLPQISVHCMDAGRLGFPDGAFELVTAGFVLQVLDDPAAALVEIRRVLTPGGSVALSVDTQSIGRLNWLPELTADFFGQGQGSGSSGGARAATESDRTDDLLARAGFTDIRRETVTVLQPIPDPPALWDWMMPRGLTEVLKALPADRAEDFRQAFMTHAEPMHSAEDGIVLDFVLTLHLAKAPQ